MELKEPKKKAVARGGAGNFDGPRKNAKIEGFFNGFCVVLANNEENIKIVNSGVFGKGNLSRNEPLFDKNNLVIRTRQFERRKNWSEKYGTTSRLKKVIVISDSDSENEECNLKPVYQIDSSRFGETINLTLPEAYFLLKYLQCLLVYHGKELLNEETCWDLFRSSDKYFVQNYVCYHHFKLKNWVVKPGIKFGGDFLLYKEGPASYHASYVVIIDVVDKETLKRDTGMCRRCMNPKNIFGLNRLCETTGKDLLLFQILWPRELKEARIADISSLEVKEILLRRWDPNAQSNK